MERTSSHHIAATGSSIAGDLNMIARCDALVLTPDGDTSHGVQMERAYAESLGIPVYVAPDLPALHAAEVCCSEDVREAREAAGKVYRRRLAELAKDSG